MSRPSKCVVRGCIILFVFVFCQSYFLESVKFTFQFQSVSLVLPSHLQGQSQTSVSVSVGVGIAAQQILSLRNLSTPEALPLSQLYAPWEVASINVTCKPPHGTPTRCCLGSTSGGGAVRYSPLTCEKAPYGHFPRPSGVEVGSGVHAIFDSLFRNNWTLAITGDSVMRQMAHGFECEWLRSGEYETVSLREEPREKRDFWRVGIGHVMEWKVGKKHNNESRADANNHNQQQQVVRIRFYDQYRPYEDMSEMEEIVTQNDIVLLSFGVHWMWHQRSEFEIDMRRLWTFLRPYTSQRMVIWRETYPQFHKTEGGEFFHPRPKPTDDQRCDYPKYGPTIQHMWRDKRIAATLAKLRIPIEYVNQTALYSHNETTNHHPPPIYWLPVHDPMLGLRPDMHPTRVDDTVIGNETCDATHMCHSPYIWSNTWQGLAISLARYEVQKSVKR